MNAPTKPEGDHPSHTTGPPRASSSALATPGWYQDPFSDAQLRWWDGSAWTNDTRPYPPTRGAARPSMPSSYAKGYRVGALAVLVLAVLLAVGGTMTGEQSLAWVSVLAIGGALGLGAAADDASHAGRYLALFLCGAVVALLVNACGAMLWPY